MYRTNVLGPTSSEDPFAALGWSSEPLQVRGLQGLPKAVTRLPRDHAESLIRDDDQALVASPGRSQIEPALRRAVGVELVEVREDLE